MFKKLNKIFFGILSLVALFVIIDISYYFIFPNTSKLKTDNPAKTSFMLYREKQWQKKGIDKESVYIWKPFYSISRYLRVAVEITEDAYFWGHHGFEWDAIWEAIKRNWETKSFKFGASTITQQLARNLYLTPSKNPVRKFKEAIITWRLERTLTKTRILELYLNVVEWGDGIYGAEAAARHYFHKSAYSLTPHEAARLALILPSPRRYNPLKNSGYITKRADIVVEAMMKRGIIDATSSQK